MKRPRPAALEGHLTRRSFLGLAGSCTAHLALVGLPMSRLESIWAVAGGRQGAGHRGPVAPLVQEVPWGRLHEIADGVWALVSTPLEDQTTLCNGGIVAGSDGVVIVEAFGSPAGLRWMAEQARAFTGRWPDHVVVTHYHGDHSNGLPAASSEEFDAVAHATDATIAQARETARARDDAALDGALSAATIIPPDRETVLDLGGRRLTLHPTDGHTRSDTWVEVDDPGVVFCGDLVWNEFFPNYMDARPDRLRDAVAAIPRGDGRIFVPGHGPLADEAAFSFYVDLLDQVEAQGRRAAEAGWTAEEAAERFAPEGPAANWFRFSPRYPERALASWLDVLTQSG